MKKISRMIAVLFCPALLCLFLQVTAFAEGKISYEITYADKYTCLTLTPSGKNNIIRYTTDGSEPDSSSPVCTDRIKTKKAVTVNAAEFNQKGKKVSSVKVELKRMCSGVSVSSEKADNGYIVTLSADTKGCDIYYTTDGSEPGKKSQKYDGAFLVGENTEVRAFARKSGWKNGPAAVNVISAETAKVFLPEEEAKALELINRYRESCGLSPLIPDAQLCEAAEIRAGELAKKNEHIRPDGSAWYTVLNEVSFRYASAAENIAWGEGTKRDADTAVRSWINSDTHRANILAENMEVTGIFSYSKGKDTYWVQLFGKRK